MTPTSPVAARAARTTASRSASAPFWGLMFFTFILYISPQVYMPFLQPLRLAMVSSGLAIILYLLDRVFRGGDLTVTIPPIKLVFVFFVMAAVSVPSSLWPGGSFEILTGDLWKSILIFLLLANVVDTVRRMKVLIASLACWGTFMAISGARDFASGNLSQGRIVGYESALAGNPNDFAFTLNLIIAAVFGLFFATTRTAHRVLLGGAVAVMTWGIITSFSRAGFLTLITIGIVILIERLKKGDTLTVMAVVGLALLVTIMSPAGYGNRVYSIVDMDADPSGSARGRYEDSWAGLSLIAARPVLGYGLGMNGLAFVDIGRGWTGLHNVFLQVAADLGVPALIVYCLMLWALFKGVNSVTQRHRTARVQRDARAQRETAAQRELAALTVGVRMALISFMVGGFFHPAAYHFYFFYTAGLAVALQTIARGLAAGEAPAVSAPATSSLASRAVGTRWRPARSVR